MDQNQEEILSGSMNCQQTIISALLAILASQDDHMKEAIETLFNDAEEIKDEDLVFRINRGYKLPLRKIRDQYTDALNRYGGETVGPQDED